MFSGSSTSRSVDDRRFRGFRRCLFGLPDRDETTRMMEEQYARERSWFIRRFDFDIETEGPPAKVARLESPVNFWDEPKDALASVENIDVIKLRSPLKRSKGGGSSSPKTPRTPRTPRAARTPRTPRTPASRKQLQLTDYWTSRKLSDSTSSDKEN